MLSDIWVTEHTSTSATRKILQISLARIYLLPIQMYYCKYNQFSQEYLTFPSATVDLECNFFR